jgi:hypothetical protein
MICATCKTKRQRVLILVLEERLTRNSPLCFATDGLLAIGFRLFLLVTKKAFRKPSILKFKSFNSEISTANFAQPSSPDENMQFHVSYPLSLVENFTKSKAQVEKPNWEALQDG